VGKTAIEWTDRTANPIRARDRTTGKIGWHCVKCSPGCAHCYAAGLNRFRGTGRDFTKADESAVEVFFDPKSLEAIRRQRKPERHFLCDMTDLFGDFVRDEWIDRVHAYAALAPSQTLQILTKRACRLRDYLNGPERPSQVLAAARSIVGMSAAPRSIAWPLRNVWHGVSVENRRQGLPRIEALRAAIASVRFLSIEPLIEDVGELNLDGVHWVILGGESGRRARPMHPGAALSIRDQCLAAGVPFFFKQWGEWLPAEQWGCTAEEEGYEVHRFPDGREMYRVGKKAAGRWLDGDEEWSEFPS